MASLEPDSLTWTGLLAQWVQFAQAALALPDDSEREQWRKSVVPIINLQAVTFSLGDLDRLPAQEHALALDKAEMLITEHAAAIESIWPQARHDSLAEIVRDARAALSVRRKQAADRSLAGQ